MTGTGINLATIISLVTATVAVLSIIVAYRQFRGHESELNRVKSNCIATLTRDVEEINKKLDCLKVDGIIEWRRGIDSQLQTGCNHFERLEKCHEDTDRRLTVNEMHVQSFIDRLRNLYTQIDKHRLETQEQMRLGFDRLEKKIDSKGN